MSFHHHLIAGERVSSVSTRKNISPSDTSDVIGEFSEADAAQVDLAVRAAHLALPQWSRSTPQQRFDVLDFIGSEILARKQELGTLLAREKGKVLSEAIGEVTRAGYVFKFFAGEALRIGGQAIASVRPGIEVITSREAVGVVGLITPWNFPVAIPAWKTAPALACGNTVVLKPEELTPACASALADIIHRSSLPPGTFNLIMGDGVAGKALVEPPSVDPISFTGSVATGKLIAQHCTQHLKKFQLEMGGKNPLVILDDADLPLAVECAATGVFFSTGQRCTASSRTIVIEKIYADFSAAFIARTRDLRVGNALAASTQIGPVVDQRQLDKNLSYIDIGQAEGGQLLVGGQRLADAGFFFSPAIIENHDAQARLNQEEVFGPVSTLIKVKDFEQAGMVMFNTPTVGVDYHVPFGGSKASSFGPREQGGMAMEFYTRVKTHYLA